MPKLKDGHFRMTRDGYWQVRYRRGGFDVQFTNKKKSVVMERFREWARSVEEEKVVPQCKSAKHDVTLAEFADLYFENVKAVNVKEVTFEMQSRCLRNHILPGLGLIPLRDLTPMNCQVFLNGLLELGLGRTADEARVLLKEILRAAVGERLITSNPMDYVKLPKHQSVHGRALSKAEIADFIERCKSSFYQKQYMLYLYTGIRRSEIASVTIDENFVTVANGKCRKGYRQTYRKIPIAPGLRKYLPMTAEDIAKCGKVLTNCFKKLFPSHQLYDLRHTFTTRCQECGIAKELVDVWTGHVNRSDMTTAVYTHFSDEFMLREIEKLDY